MRVEFVQWLLQQVTEGDEDENTAQGTAHARSLGTPIVPPCVPTVRPAPET